MSTWKTKNKDKRLTSQIRPLVENQKWVKLNKCIIGKKSDGGDSDTNRHSINCTIL